MRNIEESGIVIDVAVAMNKKKGIPVMSLTFKLDPRKVGDKSKILEAMVFEVNDTVHGFQFGQKAMLRFENVEWEMQEFNKISLGCSVIKVLGSSAFVAVPVVAPVAKAA